MAVFSFCPHIVSSLWIPILGTSVFSHKDTSQIGLGPTLRVSFNITVIQVYTLTTNAKDSEVEQFYEDLQYLLELTPKNDVFFIIGDKNAKVGSQEIPGDF